MILDEISQNLQEDEGLKNCGKSKKLCQKKEYIFLFRKSC